MNGYHSTMNSRHEIGDRRRWGFAATVLALLAIVAPINLVAQDISVPQTPHPAAQKAIASLRSPYCPGFMLEVCTSSRGASLRDSLQVMAEAGGTADELIDWVLANHGDTLLALPSSDGKGLMAWIVPPAVFLLGLSLVLVALRVMKRRAGPEEEKSAELSPEEQVSLATALKQLEEEEEPVF
jgi:cytochrome c-type biogenesis protein CcmH